MIDRLVIIVVFLLFGPFLSAQKIIARQGRVAFFSYTPVENIKAENNQVLALVDLANGQIAVSMLMNAFVFEKAQMREHFNESYVESDIYPKATFEGALEDFDPLIQEERTYLIEGSFTMHGVTKMLQIKAKLTNEEGHYLLIGTFQAVVEDYRIKIPPLLAGNIAKVVTVEFRFEFEAYEE